LIKLKNIKEVYRWYILVKHLIKNLIEEDIRAKLVTDLFSVKIDFDRAIFFLDSLKYQDYDIYNKYLFS
jgi:hypothetical protein